jgi:hypothetical protein
MSAPPFKVSAHRLRSINEGMVVFYSLKRNYIMGPMQDTEARDWSNRRAMSSRLWILVLAVLFTGSISSCATFEKGIEYYGTNSIINHRSPLVAVPAFTGMVVGFAAGLPLDIPFLFFAAAKNGPERQPGETTDEYYKRRKNFHKDSKLPHWAAAPSFLLGFVGQQTIGLPCWTLFGWWWPASDFSFLFGNVKRSKPASSEKSKEDIKPEG